MIWERMRRQNGQALIQVVLAMGALVAILALAVDVGHLYGERRRMQNAADAGALAGARALCLGAPGPAASATAVAYAQARNGASQASVTFPQAYWVSVTATERVDTFFAGIIGVSTVDVPANAVAACGQATTGCALWPIAIKLVDWLPVKGHCGAPITLLDSDKDGTCGGTRGWLNFGKPDPSLYGDINCGDNCGANGLRCWLDTLEPLRIPLPSCIPGKSGVTNSACKDIEQKHIGQVVRIPIFDSTGCSNPITGCGNCTYHVVELACLRVTSADCKGSYKHVEAEVVCKTDPDYAKCTADCASTGGAPPGTGTVNAVSLVK